MIVFWLNHTCTTSGSKIKYVRCEECGDWYVYRLNCWARGTGTAVYGLGNEAAKRSAQSRAERALEATLDKDFEVVPCVHCGWYQEYMVERMRRNRCKWLFNAGAICLFVALMCALAVFVSWNTTPRQNWQVVTFAVLSWSFVVVGLLCFMQRIRLINRYDPNDGPLDERLETARHSALSLREFKELSRKANAELEDRPVRRQRSKDY